MGAENPQRPLNRGDMRVPARGHEMGTPTVGIAHLEVPGLIFKDEIIDREGVRRQKDNLRDHGPHLKPHFEIGGKLHALREAVQRGDMHARYWVIPTGIAITTAIVTAEAKRDGRDVKAILHRGKPIVDLFRKIGIESRKFDERQHLKNRARRERMKKEKRKK